LVEAINALGSLRSHIRTYRLAPPLNTEAHDGAIVIVVRRLTIERGRPPIDREARILCIILHPYLNKTPAEGKSATRVFEAGHANTVAAEREFLIRFQFCTA
jgi:hypothetical protein